MNPNGITGAATRNGEDSEPRNILILKPSSLGDVIQALPVLRLLRRRYPASRIYWWLLSDLAPLLERDPDLSGLILFDRKGWRHLASWGPMIRSFRQIRRQEFDWVIDLQSLLRSALLAWISRAKLTIGLDDPREGAGTFYDMRVPRGSFHVHAVDWYLEVLRKLQVPVDRDFDWIPVHSAAREIVRRLGQPEKGDWIVLNPGARWTNKRWPAEYYAQLAGLLSSEKPAPRFVILGGTGDQELGDQIARANPGRCLDLTGRTTLPEMVEWIRFSRLMVTNDTGPMHVAAALGKPVVALFGPTEPHRTGPYGQFDHVLQHPLACRPCMKASCHYEKNQECLRGIKPERVARAVQDHWRGDAACQSRAMP
ncbi:MAG TPA: lipopolysaccharide heptosyltransferase II [Candidatus Paceibacterota bacterium]|nr:lipopolysaccharide heptosyltransferase II [Verrucomicrobiota bacterium]HRY48783.1 lipopolysaccharide heptosyltransferase II [Candidatus Paceibacterota bacterium]